jgi:hypothetical protein
VLDEASQAQLRQSIVLDRGRDAVAALLQLPERQHRTAAQLPEDAHHPALSEQLEQGH